MALAANALTTVTAVRAGLKVPDTDVPEVERLIGVASDAIERYCGRAFVSAQVTEKLAGTGANRLVLSRTPVTAIASIADDGQTVAATEYEIEDAEVGFIWRDRGWPSRDRTTGVSVAALPRTGRKTIAVTYTGGYAAIPPELEQACIDIVVSLWRRRGADRDASAYDSSNLVIGRGLGGIIPGSSLHTLNRFRAIVP